MKVQLLLAAALAASCAGAMAQEIVLRFGHVVQPGHPISLGSQKLAEILAAKSGGKIKLQELGGGVVGGEAQQLSAVQGGILDMTLPSATIMGGVVKEFTLLDIPFSFTRAEQVDALLGGPFGQLLMSRLAGAWWAWDSGRRALQFHQQPRPS